MSNNTVFVTILDREYQVACPDEERSALLQSAQELDSRMRAIRNTGSVIGLERIAVMAALNLSHELLQASGGGVDSGQLQGLSDKIDSALERLG